MSAVECSDRVVSVRDIMRRVHVTASPDESVGRALEKMQLFHTHLLVVVREQEVVGVVFDRALMRVRASARTPAAVEHFMSRAIAPVPPTMAAREAQELLEDRGLDAIAVVHRGTVIGTVCPAVVLSKRALRRARGVRSR